MNLPVYLDHNATTPVDPKVLEGMIPYFQTKFGNASSIDHKYGYEASSAVENARNSIAKLIGANNDEIIFTSGATESINMAIMGIIKQYEHMGDHIITCTTEHKAVLDTMKHMESTGKQVTYLSVDHKGHIDIDDLKNAITDKTILISIMFANNEIGTIHDVRTIGKIARERSIIFHTDAAQAVGRIKIDVKNMNIDLMSFSAHKIYGPKGVGALYVNNMKPRVKLFPILYGGGQEKNLRSGTLNVPGIVGFGIAAEIINSLLDNEIKKLCGLSNFILEKLESIGGKVNGDIEKRLPGNLNISFENIDGKAIINTISDKVAISASSACTTQNVEPSHVLLALGLNANAAHSSIRIGVGRFNDMDEMNFAVTSIINAVKELRNIQ